MEAEFNFNARSDPNEESKAAYYSTSIVSEHGIGHSHDNTAQRNPAAQPGMNGNPNNSVARTKRLGPTNAGIDARLKMPQDNVDKVIKRMLDDVHPGSADLYYRLTSTKAPQGTPLENCASVVVLDANWSYLRELPVEAAINKLVKQVLKSVSSL